MSEFHGSFMSKKMSTFTTADVEAGLSGQGEGEGSPLLPPSAGSAPTQVLHDTRPPVDTRLHEAARAQDLETLRELLAAGASPAALDKDGLTPLHVCVVERLLEPLKVLLSVPSANDCLVDGLPVVHAALHLDWSVGARAALDAGARVDHEANKFGETLLDLAIENGDMEIFKTILNVAEREGVLDCFNWTNGETALATAIKASNLPAVKALLEKGASPKKVSTCNDTALHVAVHDTVILKYILDKTDVTSSTNEDGEFPIHLAIKNENPESIRSLLNKFNNTRVKTEQGSTPLHYAVLLSSNEAAEIILERDSEAIDVVDNKGDTPLHTAVKANNRDLTALLLRKGANLSTKDKEGVTGVELITKNFYKASDYFDFIFDGFISNMKDDDTGTLVNYQVLTNGKDMSQMKVLEEFVRCGQAKILIHPLIESLLYTKWTHFLPLFYGIICVYAVFLASFNVLIFNLFCSEDMKNNSINSSVTSNASIENNSVNSSGYSNASSNGGGVLPKSGVIHGELYWLWIGLLYISIFILLLQESCLIYLRRGRYFVSVESWVKLSGLTLCAAAPIAALAQGPWPRHVACAALLLTWLQAMFLISRGPRWGYYVLMFGKVAINILKIFVTAIFLVIGFAFCFMIQYRSVYPFNGPFVAFVKTLFMMSTEFDYDTLSGKDHEKQLEDTKPVVDLLFVIFVIFVAIVLMNFMIGVAVSDMNDLNEAGNIGRLKKQVELLSALDALAYDGIFAKWFKNMFGDRRYHGKMYFWGANGLKWEFWDDGHIEYSVHIRSSTLHHAIIDTANKNDQQVEQRNIDKNFKCKINALYDAIVDRPVATSKEREIGKRKTNHPIWLRKVITKQNEQIKSLVDDLSKVKCLIEDLPKVKLSLEDLNIKISRLLSEISEKTHQKQ